MLTLALPLCVTIICFPFKEVKLPISYPGALPIKDYGAQNEAKCCDDSCRPHADKRAPVDALQTLKTLQRGDEKEETQPGKAQFGETMYIARQKRPRAPSNKLDPSVAVSHVLCSILFICTLKEPNIKVLLRLLIGNCKMLEGQNLRLLPWQQEQILRRQ